MPVPGHSPIRRFLMTADTVGSVWTYALDLAQALQEYGIDIALATMGPSLNTQQRTAVQQIKNITLYESTCKLEWREGAWDDVAAAGAWLLELEDLTQPDVVHLNGYAYGALPWQSSTLQGSAAIFAMPACYEPCGLAALEAGLAGCALVLGDIPSLRELHAKAALSRQKSRGVV